MVFFAYYEEHCGISAAIRKANLQDDKDFDCNPDYNLLISHDANVDSIKGMQYNWDGIHPGDIYNYVDVSIFSFLLRLLIRTSKLTRRRLASDFQ